MLMPSGMCLCQLVTCGEPAAVQTSGSPSGPPSAAGACPHWDTHGNAPALDDDSVDPSGPTHATLVPGPCPCPRDHHPDCPVLTGLSIRVAVLADTVVGQGAASIVPTGWACPAVSSGLLPDPPGAEPQAPLFISHCALLI